MYAATDVTGQSSIIAGSLVEAWVFPLGTADHSADEHVVDPPRVIASDIVAGTGFTIHALPNESPPQINERLLYPAAGGFRSGGEKLYALGTEYSLVPMHHGKYTVAWAWN